MRCIASFRQIVTIHPGVEKSADTYANDALLLYLQLKIIVLTPCLDGLYNFGLPEIKICNECVIIDLENKLLCFSQLCR